MFRQAESPIALTTFALDRCAMADLPTDSARARWAQFSRFRGTIQQGPVKRQETQIVQSCNTLDDFLPGFRP